jgi:hypothetical protein
MDDGTKRLLLGIDVTIFGVILALLSSGSAAVIALVVGLLGLAICVAGMVTPSRT